MRLIKRLIELAFFVFLLSLFGKNMDVSVQIKYYGLSQPITVQFWELVLFCVAFGIIIAAIGDFITQLKWMGEKRRMIKTDKGHQAEVQSLSDKIRELEAENQRVQRDLEQKSKELEQKTVEVEQRSVSGAVKTGSPDAALDESKEPVDAEDPFEKAKAQTAQSGTLLDSTSRDERS